MDKNLVAHHNLIGHEINISLTNFGDDPLDREIYCRKQHIVTEPSKEDCSLCPYFKGFEQGYGIECEWYDIGDKAEAVIRHERRYQEYARVDKLIKQGILLPASKLIELHVKNKKYNPAKWIYRQTNDMKYRFILGERGKNPLICIGVNPSTASPEDLDKTMIKVKRKSELEGYDGYIMLNLSPQRATNPDDMDVDCNFEAFEENISVICDVLNCGQFTIWAAWGKLIDKREYLYKSLEEIRKIADKYNCTWLCCGTTSEGHPRHPLYLQKNAKMIPFNINDYLNSQRSKYGK